MPFKFFVVPINDDGRAVAALNGFIRSHRSLNTLVAGKSVLAMTFDDLRDQVNERARGMPLAVDARLFNCAAVIHRGAVLGVAPKCFPPNYKEFYEGRWFSPAATARSSSVRLNGKDVPFGADLLFAADGGLTVGVEVCE